MIRKNIISFDEISEKVDYEESTILNALLFLKSKLSEIAPTYLYRFSVANATKVPLFLISEEDTQVNSELTDNYSATSNIVISIFASSVSESFKLLNKTLDILRLAKANHSIEANINYAYSISTTLTPLNEIEVLRKDLSFSISFRRRRCI